MKTNHLFKLALALFAALTGHLTWILSLVNIAFLLFKDHVMISWVFIIVIAVLFLISTSILISSLMKD